MKTLKIFRPRKRGSNDLNFPGSLNLRWKKWGEKDRGTGEERLSKAERHGMAFVNVCKISFYFKKNNLPILNSWQVLWWYICFILTKQDCGESFF